jgi:hypothetical protein
MYLKTFLHRITTIDGRQSGRRAMVIPALLLAIFVVAQFCLVVHATEHALHEADEACELCIAADHLTHGLIMTAMIEPVPEPVYFNPRIEYPQSRSPAAVARAPPV